MKKIYIVSDVTWIDKPIGGPTICMKLLQDNIKKYLKNTNQEHLITIKCTQDDIKDSIIWHWSPIYDINNIKKIVDNNNFLITGPNAFFKGGNITDYEKYLIENNIINYLFLHPNQYKNSEYFNKFTNGKPKFDIIYPISYDSFISNESIERTNDIIIYTKFYYTSDILINNLTEYKIKIINYGDYKIDELIHYASISKCCLYLAFGETGGTACAELLCNGCPIISWDGNLTYGDDNINCIKLNNNGYFNRNFDIIKTHINKCFNMNNIEIAKNAREKFDLDKITIEIIEKLKDISNNL